MASCSLKVVILGLVPFQLSTAIRNPQPRKDAPRPMLAHLARQVGTALAVALATILPAAGADVSGESYLPTPYIPSTNLQSTR